MKKNKHNIETGSAIERSDERIKETQEVFTPMDLVENMVNDIPEEMLKDPSSTFLDNSAGSGNFIVALKNKLLQYHSEDHIVNHMLYAVELMEDNHKELCERVGVSVNHPHYVCVDALEYDYSFGEPMVLEDYGLGKLPRFEKPVKKIVEHTPSEARLPI